MHRPPAGHRRRRRLHVPGSDRRTRRPCLDAHRQRPRLHGPLRRRTERVRIPPPAAGHPSEERLTGHPQTQGKIERFHQTLKRWLAAHPAPATLDDLQAQLDLFRTHYNEQRPHRSNDRTTPGDTYRATPKALPTARHQGHYRLRYDHVGTNGKMSLRRAGRMHHLGIGDHHRGKRILALTDETTVTVIHLDPGEILSTHEINPDRSYWRNQQQEPGRWPGS